MTTDAEVYRDMQAALERIVSGRPCYDADPAYRAGWDAAMRWARDEVAFERDRARRRYPQLVLPMEAR